MANKLRAIRKSQGLTLEEVAEKCGVSSQSVSRWETGKTYISDERFEQLASLYGYNAEELKGYVLDSSVHTYLKDKLNIGQDFDNVIGRSLEEINELQPDDPVFNRAQLILNIYNKIARLSDVALIRIDERIDTLLSMQEDK